MTFASPMLLAVIGAQNAAADPVLENTCTYACVMNVSDGGGGFTLVTDTDCDSWSDGDDNCDADQNADQADADTDGLGDACDTCPTDAGNDPDGDGICAAVDNCPGTANSGQEDADGDGVGDACDVCFGSDNVDSDGDGFCNSVDVCEGDDGSGDDDLDEVCNDTDLCPDGDIDPAEFEDFLGEIDGCAEVCVDPGADVAADFSYAANPTATGWTYGRLEAGVFTAHAFKNSNTALKYRWWRAFSASTSTPRINDCYDTAGDCVLAAATIPNDELVLQPSDTAQSVARYSVGDAGEINFDFTFTSARTSGAGATATTHVIWRRGATVLADEVGSVTGLVTAGPGHQGTFTLDDAQPGDIVDFVVDSNGSTSSNDWVSLAAFTSCPF